MSTKRSLRKALGRKLVRLGKSLAPKEGVSERPDWQQADPGFIESALEHAVAQNAGGWVVVAPSRSLTKEPLAIEVDGKEWVVFRDGDKVHAAPAACPHMGADLSCGKVREGALVCPWHGLELGAEGHGTWQVRPALDDGQLIWARLLEETPLLDAPPRMPRPSKYVAGVIEADAICDPSDVIANRLDPWHGAHYHPHSFAELEVKGMSLEALEVRVAYRVAGRAVVEVDCTFSCPGPRTITMEIVGGEGQGSVVETHATPLADGRTRVTELTLATSDRPGFLVATKLGPVLRRFIEQRAAKLWVEDVAYAERRYAIRQKASSVKKRSKATKKSSKSTKSRLSLVPDP